MTHAREGNGAGRNRADVPGAVFLLAHDVWRGHGPPSAADAARALSMPESAFAPIQAFHREVVERSPDVPLILCRGVSCRLHGADEFHAALKTDLAGAGVLGTTIDVHCLSQCPHGPNLKLRDDVLCTGKRVVVNDARPWRPVTAGPKPLESDVERPS